MSGAHAFLPPSGAACWELCAAWPLMNASFPQDDTDESREGTAAHWCWDGELREGLGLPALGAIAPNGVAVTEEMLDGAEEYIEIIRRDMQRAGVPFEELHVEERVDMPDIHALNWGTPDSWFFAPSQWTLYQYDYKFGHDPVDAFEHRQSIDYTAGIIEKLAQAWGMTFAELDQRIRVCITVVQPRNYQTDRVTRWEVLASDLRPFWNRLTAAGARAMEYPPVATPGEVQCEHCPGSHACAPLQRAGYRAVHFAKRSLPALLTPEAVGAELRILQDNMALLKARIDGLEADAEARIRRNESVPGYGLDATKGREGWTVAPEQVVALGQLFGQDLRKPATLTPAQARSKGIPAEVIAKHASTPTRGVKLVRVAQSNLRKAFGEAK